MLGPSDPIAVFRKLWAEARAGVDETRCDAAVLATVDDTGRPAARVVLVREATDAGFVFYTNGDSRKGRDLLARPEVALCWHWAHIQVQARVEGTVAPTSAAESDAYFASRARESQVGAWASEQSQPLSSRFRLLRRFLAFQLKFAGGDVPRPPRWSGFRVTPRRIEVWYSRPHRLHDRHEWTRTPDGWRHTLLYP